MNQSAFIFSPRTPQQGKTREFSSQTDRAEGRADSFFLKGRRRHFYFFWFLTLKPLETRMVVRKMGNRVGRFFPIFAMFLPRVGLILPIVVFFGLAPLFLFFFQITEEREERRGISGGETSIQESVLKTSSCFFCRGLKNGHFLEELGMQYEKSSMKSTILCFFQDLLGFFQKCVWVSVNGLTAGRGNGCTTLD